MSLRVQLQCFGTLAVILLTAKRDTFRFHLLVGLLALQACDSVLYNDFVANKKTAKEVLAFIGDTQKGRAFLDSDHGAMFELYLLKGRTVKDPSVSEIVKRYMQQKETVTTSQEAKRKASMILDNVNAPYCNYDMVEQVAKAITLSNQFSLPGV